MKTIFLKARCALLIPILALSAPIGSKAESSSLYKDRAVQEAFAASHTCALFNTPDNVTAASRFYELIFGKREKEEEILLCPSGEAFGIFIKEDGVTVSTSQAPDILAGDRIIRIGKTICSETKDVYEAVKESGGAPLKITLIRGGEEITVTATPKYKDGEYVLGITLRAQTAGIGTITFIDPNTLSFGGLGHAVSDSETGAPVSVKSGVA